MYFMLYGTTAFNQPLSFDTAKVTTVREYSCMMESNHNEKPGLIFYFPSNLFLDERHALWYNSVQSTTTFQYCGGYSCEMK